VVRFDDPLAEAVRRLQACEAAGARCVYPVRVPDAETLRTLHAEMSGPVNITAHPVDGAPSGSFEELQAAGVQRITFGPLLMAAVTAQSQNCSLDGSHPLNPCREIRITSIRRG
jgi:2-methylisocitrate lyase-like PEP mutase family enzyme